MQIRIQSSTWIPRDDPRRARYARTWRHDRQGRDSVVFDHLQIPYRQERVLVGLADAGLAAAKRLGWPRTARARQRCTAAPDSSAATGAGRRPGDGARSHCDGQGDGAGGRNRSRRRKLESVARGTDSGRARRNARCAVDGARGRGLSWTAACAAGARVASQGTTISRSISSPTFAAICCSLCREHAGASGSCRAEAAPC